MKVLKVRIHFWLAIFVSTYTSTTAVISETKECKKPECFIYVARNASLPITVALNGKDSSVTTFCFKGVMKSLLRLWVNPVLQLAREPTSINESSKFVWYYGTSVLDVESRSQQPGYRMLQEMTAKLRPLKQTDDLSLDPFNLSCVSIDTNVEYKAHVKIKAADLWYISYLIVGTLIFFSAKSWSQQPNAPSPVVQHRSQEENARRDQFQRKETGTEMCNTSLHYGTGVSVGVVASILVLVFIISKFLPSKLKNLGYILMLFGGSVSLWFLTSIGNLFSDPVTDRLLENWQYVLSYIAISGVLSFALVYRYGPVTDERSLSLIQWFLQLVGLILVYNSTQIREVSIALVLVLLAIYNFPKNIIINTRSKNLWYRFFPPKMKLLTEDEYIIQGNVETKKELEKLREYCRSPDCQAWKIISKLKSPHRFAEFVEGSSWHVTDEELLDYDSGPDPIPPHLVSDDDDEDEEEEMDFILNSP